MGNYRVSGYIDSIQARREPVKVKISTGQFKTASFASTWNRPKLMEWDHEPGLRDVRVFTDSHLASAHNDPSPRRIGLLIESPSVRPHAYKLAEASKPQFDTILTFKRDLLKQGRPFLFYPLGGTWIENWRIHPKSKMVSMLVSQKVGQRGHQLRHTVKSWEGIDTYGRGVDRYVTHKEDALRDYRFAIVIENCREDWYFSEKLIDCLSQGTVPLYWGCPDIGQFFNTAGIIQWTTIDQLRYKLKNLTEHDYARRMGAIVENFEAAKEYACPEDWICRRYPGLLS